MKCPTCGQSLPDDSLKEENESLSLDNRFFEEHIGFVVDDDDKYYHSYHCYAVETADTYEAHNVNYFQWLEYEPCSYCW